jgi:hypothetical protein
MEDQLRDWLAKQDYEAITELAGRKRRVLSFLTALTYDLDPLISWRAVEAMGLAAGRISDEDPEYVRVHLRRLMWLLNDESGSIGWHAPEMMGELLRSRPQRFTEFVPIVISILDLEEEDAVRFRAGTLWAIGRAGRVNPAAVEAAIPGVVPCLDDSDPQTRGLAAWCLGQLGVSDQHLGHRDRLLSDPSPVEWYEGGQLVTRRVGELARAALESSRRSNS